MTQWLYIQCVLMYMSGSILHILLVKLPTVRRRDKAANIKFSFRSYLKEDWNVIAGNFIVGGMLILGADEIIGFKPWVLGVIKWMCAFVGMSGSSVVMSIFSKYERKVLSIVDQKTNISDLITKEPVTKVSEIKSNN